MTWLLTGGAGYIGAHIVRALQASGRKVVVLDDLSSGLAENVPSQVPLVRTNVGDRQVVEAALRAFDVRGVIHLAAKKAPAESVERPLFYYRENVAAMGSLLEAMLGAGVHRIVFSSSCSVYGTPAVEQVTEETATSPESPYGRSKLIGEWMLRDVAVATPIRYASLRYFNVAGSGAPELGDRGVFNLIPMVFEALTNGRTPKVFGTDYPTRDGSCIRDYIHVADLAEAHVAAAAVLERPDPPSAAYNIGRGEGVTVLEVLDTIRAVTGIDFVAEHSGRRAGDPVAISALTHFSEESLNWRASRDLHDMVASAWEAWQHRM